MTFARRSAGMTTPYATRATLRRRSGVRGYDNAAHVRLIQRWSQTGGQRRRVQEKLSSASRHEILFRLVLVASRYLEQVTVIMQLVRSTTFPLMIDVQSAGCFERSCFAVLVP